MTGCTKEQNNKTDIEMPEVESEVNISETNQTKNIGEMEFIEIPFGYVENNSRYEVCRIKLPSDLNILGYQDEYGFEHWEYVDEEWFENFPREISKLTETPLFRALCISDEKQKNETYYSIEITEEPYLTYGLVGELSTTQTEYKGYVVRYSEKGTFQIELSNGKYLDIHATGRDWRDVFEDITFDNSITENLIDLNENPLDLLYHNEETIEYAMFDDIINIILPKNSIYEMDENLVLHCDGYFDIEVNNDEKFHAFTPHLDNTEQPVTYEVTENKDEYLIVRLWAIKDMENITGYEEYVEIRYYGNLLHETDSKTLAEILSKIVKLQ